MELRPLDFGEIFERAIALYVRNFLALIGIVAASIAPVAVVQYVTFVFEQPRLDATMDVLQHPERLRTEHVPTLFSSPASVAVAIAGALFGYYMLAFAVAAVAAGVGRRYDGQAMAFRACYAPVVRRWPAIVMIVGMAILTLVAAYLAAVAVVAIAIAIAAAGGATLFSAVVVLGVTVMIAGIAFALLVILVTSACAVDGAVIENWSATTALRFTLARIFNHREFGRALLCSLAVGTIASLCLTTVDAAAYLGLARWPAAYVALDALARVLVVPFLAVVLAVYYFDVRVRQEGLDLDRDGPLAPASDEPVYAPTAYLSGEERALVKRFLERRESLSTPRRQAIAAQLAAPARTRVPQELRALDDESLLERL
jgi:hypothetical protein